VVATASIAGACGAVDRPGLQVKGYAADIVFTKKPAKSAPLLGPLPADLTGAQALADVGLPSLAPAGFDNPAPGTKYTGPPLSTRPPCRAAPPGSTAPQAAVTVPDGVRPETGTYRWRKTGTFSPTATPDLKLPLGGFEVRKLRNIRELGSGVFSFETLQPDPTGKYVRLTTWQVKPDAVASRAAALSLSLAAGDPERGLAIKSIETLQADGSRAPEGAQFHPATALLVLPLPVVPGEQFSSVAVDPTTQQSAVFQAQVAARDRVDACGDFVEGWKVTGTLSSSFEPKPYPYEVWAAPQLGAMPLLERTTRTQAGVGTLDATYTLAQLHPEPEAMAPR